MSTKRLPKGFKVNNQDGTVACPHRNLSCCDSCAEAHDEILDVVGMHFWIPDSEERAFMLAEFGANV